MCPSRNEAISALNSVKKTVITQPETAPRPSAAGTSNFQASIGRIRDRMTVTAAMQETVAPKPLTERQKLTEFYYQAHLKEEAAKQAEQTEKERKRAERQAAEDRERLRKIEDARTLREARERQQQVTEHNLFASEIRGIFQSMDALDIVPEVMA